MNHRASPSPPSARIRVSVVVAVFKPGAGFDDLIASLDRQTLPATDFEVILCDDGSGEETRDLLTQVARTRPYIRILTLAHTGWPGTPRNAGIEAARGDYVQIVDQDDWLYDGALQHLCDYADRHSSDVVLGKVVGIGRKIPRPVFRKDIPHAVLGRDPLLDLLTPHKMFRTDFLHRHGIRFPEGRVRLEDHLFVMEAYFRASTISILASEPCYAWVKTPGSASSSRIDPVTYFPHLETVLDLVEANTEPGALRDTLLSHWYRGKILRRLDGRRVVKYPQDYREAYLDVVTPLAQRWFGPGVDKALVFPLRMRSALLKAGARDDLIRLAEFEASLRCRVTARSARWSRGGKLDITVDVRIEDGNGDPLVFTVKDAKADAGTPATATRPTIWQPPTHLRSEALTSKTLDAARDLRKDRIGLSVRDRVDKSEHRSAAIRMRRFAGTRAVVDPVRAFSRSDPSRGGRIMAEVNHAGWTFEVPVHASPGAVAALGRSPVLAGRPFHVAVTDAGTLDLRRDPLTGQLRDAAARVVDGPARSLVSGATHSARRARWTWQSFLRRMPGAPTRR